MAVHGGCACGSVRYVLSRKELPPVYCCHCRSALFAIAANIPDKLLLRAGTFDESDKITPVAHIYTSRKQPWLLLPSDVVQCKGAPDSRYYQLMGLA